MLSQTRACEKDSYLLKGVLWSEKCKVTYDVYCGSFSEVNAQLESMTVIAPSDMGTKSSFLYRFLALGSAYGILGEG